MSGQVETLSSASGLLSLLDEEERELQYYGLSQLDTVTDKFWAEISDSISKIEILYEDESFEHRQLAALVASKIYFHLGEFDDALNFALGAGDLFDLEDISIYVQTVVNHAIDKYIELRSTVKSDATPVDPKLEYVVERMVERCFTTKEYAQVIGIAIEANRLDILERALKSGDTNHLLVYVQNDCVDIIRSLQVQKQVLELLVKVHLGFENPNYEAICMCLSKLNSPTKTAEILKLLLEEEGGDDKVLSAYQIAFDLDANATQEFTKAVIKELFSSDENADEDDDDDDDDASSSGPKQPLDQVKSILSGAETLKLHLDFLFRNNQTDMYILNNTCKYLDSRLSLAHNAMTLANAFMHAGTTVDNFLRDNLEWLSRASNWAKFSTTAALGVIHHGQIRDGFKMIQPYLPQGGTSASPYSEGGAFLALGLVHACHGSKDIIDYLHESLETYQGQNAEILQHGTCLGLGAAGLGSGNEEISRALVNVLYTDSAIAGEAAGLGMGMVMMGTRHEETLNDMLQYAKETEHEKIIRSLAVGIGLLMFGRKQEADPLVEKLLDEEDPLLRLAAVHIITMAYCGTGDNEAIRKLLHLSVSDVKDDVRRAAVTGLGFVLLRCPEQVPRMVELLSESFNPHVRAGAALALGIACAGSGSKAAIAILEPMMKDSVDFVVESAVVALAFILIQQNETFEPKVAEVRKKFASLIETKHGEGVTKFGATLAQGIIDAGGRNVTIGLTTQDGQLNMPACAGMLLFTQFWYWFPLAHFLALSFKPTALIAINKNLNSPVLTTTCVAKKPLYVYPAMIEQPTVQAPTKVATAILSTTSKAKRPAASKEGEKEDMDVDVEKPQQQQKPSPKKSSVGFSLAASASFTVDNLSRVLPYQEKYMKWPTSSRYQPVKKGKMSGVLVVRDTRPGEPEELIPRKILDRIMPADEDEDETMEEDHGNQSNNRQQSESRGDQQQQLPEPFEYPFGDDRNKD